MAAETIGLIAGNGSFPVLFARAAKGQGLRVVAVAMRGETEERIEAEVDAITWVRVGQLGKMIRAFGRAGVTRAAMAGGVRKSRLFSGARPDLLGLRVLTRVVVRRDDGMLRAVAREFERNGITIVDSTLYMPDALAPLRRLGLKLVSRSWTAKEVFIKRAAGKNHNAPALARGVALTDLLRA